MNVSKSMMKIDMAKSLGSQYAGMAKAAKEDQLRQEGARDALKLAAQRVGALGLQLDKALEDGELTPDMLKDPKQIEIFVKRWNRRAIGVIDNLATTAEVARMDAVGRVKGLEAAEALVQGMAKSEVSKLEELQRQIESGEITVEDVQRPEAPLSLKHQREDEAAAEAAKAEETPPPEATSTPPEEPKPETKKTAAKAPKGRPKKKPVPKKKPASKKG